MITKSNIEVGEYTTYDDFVNDPCDFERNNVLYHYPECNGDSLKIGKFCSIAYGARFIFNAANHAQMDGAHAGRFLQCLQENIYNLKYRSRFV